MKVTVPALLNVRVSRTSSALPLGAPSCRLAPAATTVEPLPLIVPPDHVPWPVTVRVPGPSRMPDEKFRLARLAAAPLAAVTVPPSTFTDATVQVTPLASVIEAMPPTSTLPAPATVELPASVKALSPSKPRVDPAATLKPPVSSPPRVKLSEPAWTWTLPLLLKAGPMMVVPASPDLMNVP